MTAKALTATVAAIAVAGLLAGCGGESHPQGGHHLSGSITVPAAVPASTASPKPKPEPSPTGAPVCRAGKGYTDIHAGTRVFVRDADGNTLARGELQAGSPVPKQAGRCRFAFRVTGLPETPVYAVKVGLRDAVRYGFSDLESGGWKVSLQIG